MFHEVAHGLGIKTNLDSEETVREAMKEHASALEEGKADILGLYMVTKLHARAELGEADLMDNYVTFLAGIFRSIRFGTASLHGVANLLRFHFFQQAEAFSRDEETGRIACSLKRWSRPSARCRGRFSCCKVTATTTGHGVSSRRWGVSGRVSKPISIASKPRGFPWM